MRKRRMPRLHEGDDGRTITNMNVDGMPWYLQRHDCPVSNSGGDGLAPEQLRAYRFAAIRAALAVVLVFGAVFALFIDFCDFIWFR